MTHWDTVVVGGGPVGAATARHLALAGVRVAVIGPDEPADPSAGSVFASHYDQGRVQRLIGFDDLWTRMSVESAQVWPMLERLTGLTVHDPVGCLYLAPAQDDYLRRAPTLAEHFGLGYQPVAGAGEVARIAPGLHVPDSVVGLLERSPAGSINPRAVVAAQLQATRRAGGAVLRDVVTAIRHRSGTSELTTSAGEIHLAATVVIATGSFANAGGLLGKLLDVRVKGETVVLAEVSAATAAALTGLPSVLYEVESAVRDGIYLIKPLRYPDGRFYLKLGMNQAVDPELGDLASIQAWFRGAVPEDGSLTRLRYEVITLFPGVAFLGFRIKRCIISRTVDRKPYIGPIGDGVTVAMGCNGYSAMASDAQGRIAASVVQTGRVPAGYHPDDFTVRTRSTGMGEPRK